MDGVLENFLTHVGGCGRFQICLAIVAILVTMFSSWSLLFMVFGAYNPGCLCADGDPLSGHLNATDTITQPTKRTVDASQNGSFPETCDVNDTCTHLIFNPSASTLVTEWSLVDNKSWFVSTIFSAQMFGILIGNFVSGCIGNKYGRKVSLYAFLFLSFVSNVITIFSTSPTMFAAVYFFVGLGVGGTLAMSHVYALDFVSSRWRVYITGVPYWQLCTALFGLTIYILKDWRHIHAAAATGSFAMLLSCFWVPENLRWLAVNGKAKRAQAVAKQICKFNRKVPPKENMFAELNETLQKSSHSHVWLLLKLPLLRRIVLCTSIACHLYTTFFAIQFGIKALAGNFYLNVVLFPLTSMPSGALVPLIGNTIGRRWGSVLVHAVCSVLACVLVIIRLTLSGWGADLVVTLICMIVSALLDVVWCLTIAYLVELFPTCVRSLAIGIVYTGGRIGGILAPYVMPRSYETLYITFIIISIGCLACALMAMALPETKNRGLGDTFGTRPETVDNGTQTDAAAATRASLEYNNLMSEHTASDEENHGVIESRDDHSHATFSGNA